MYCDLKGASDSEWTSFDSTVSITDYEESFNVLDGDGTGRSVLTGSMIRDVIGVFPGHKMTFQRDGSVESFDALWKWLKAHARDDYVWVRGATGAGQEIMEYKGYYTAGRRKLHSVGPDGTRYWGAIDISFVAMDREE